MAGVGRMPTLAYSSPKVSQAVSRSVRIHSDDSRVSPPSKILMSVPA